METILIQPKAAYIYDEEAGTSVAVHPGDLAKMKQLWVTAASEPAVLPEQDRIMAALRDVARGG